MQRKWLVAIGALLVTTAYGVMLQCNSVFIIPTANFLNCTRAEVALINTANSIAGALCAPIIGKLVYKYGGRKVILITGTIISIALACYYFATNIIQFFIISIICGACYNGICFLAVTIIINQWFDTDKGKGIAVATLGSGIGSAIMIPIAQKIIDIANFKTAYLCMSITGLILLLIAVIFFIRDKNVQNTQVKQKKEKINFTLVGVVLLIGLISNAMLSSQCTGNANVFLQDAGYSSSFAARIASISFASLTIMKLILGVVYDKFGLKVGNTIIACASLTYPFFMLFCKVEFFPYLYAVDYSISGTCNALTKPLNISYVFGEDKLVTVYSIMGIIYDCLSLFISPLVGGLYDIYGTYTYSKLLICFIGFMAGVNIGIVYFIKKSKH